MGRSKRLIITLVLCTLSLFGCKCQGGMPPKLKFLIYTAADDGSHHMHNLNIAKSLIKQGHSVTFLLSSSCTKWLHTNDAHLFSFIIYQSLHTPEDRQELSRQFSLIVMNGELRSFRGILKMFLSPPNSPQRQILNFAVGECDHLLGDTEAIRNMLDARFDILIGDDISGCNPLLAHKLGLRFVMYSSLPMRPAKLALLYGTPLNPAYIPERQLGLSDNLTLWQRIVNTWMSIVYRALFYLQIREYSYLQQTYSIAPETSTLELMGRAELWIMSMDFVLEFPRPLQPNVILIVPPTVGVQSDFKIPRDQQEFVDNATAEGVVLFSLGTHVNEMEVELAAIFARGLAKLKQRVLWHFTGDITELPLGNNTKIVKWIPMQNFMEHPNVQAVLCHGGGGIIHEAVWSGIPVVGIPLFADQSDNMVRAVSKGFALSLDLFEMTEETLYQAITEVIQDPSFKENANKLSGIMKDDVLSPADKAARWINHVTRFGGNHLRPKVMDLNFIESNLIDVYGFIVAVGLVAVGLALLSVRVCYFCYRLKPLKGIRKVKQN